MTDKELKNRVLSILGEIAPEADLDSLRSDLDFREQIDIDSMDYLNFVIALDEEFQADIPETEYTRFTSLDSCIDQLKRLLAKSE
ncbi:MAG: acyl carrier protein [Pyrinomonadaceae bacterium]|nr:acyl carrier protein [Pyrinomonadaceae bacterium]